MTKILALPGFHDGEFISHMRVYYEDTDAAGAVYHSNYLKFSERARTDALRALGIDQSRLLDQEGVGFAVREAHLDFKRSARLDDLLTIRTRLVKHSAARIHMVQEILRQETMLVVIEVTLVCVNRYWKPVGIPKKLLSLLRSHFDTNM